jgi:hypothetical protein
MGEEQVAEIAHHKLANRSGHPRLRKADPTINDRHDHHQGGVESKEANVSLRKRIIDHQLQQIRIGEPNDA